jgi:hypothetical protein
MDRTANDLVPALYDTVLCVTKKFSLTENVFVS